MGISDTLKKVKSYSSVLIGFSIILFTLGFIRLSLYHSALRFSEDFEKQNFMDFSNSDVFALSSKLNSLSSSIPWVCIKASNENVVFFEKSRGNCNRSLIQDVALIKSIPNGNMVVEVVLGFDNEIKYVAIVFVFMQIIMLVLLLYTNSKKHKLENHGKLMLFNLASQVAHDIRSPLAALEMISGSLNELSEEKRLIVRNSINRIRDIANSLSVNSDKKLSSNISLELGVAGQNASISDFEIELLMPIIEMIITEKRLQFRDYIGIQIDFNQTGDSYGLFSKINTIDFKRILSNIINNSVEAFQSRNGRVIIELNSSVDLNEIIIKDNAGGIPHNIIDQLGRRGATFNKVGGSGLGLFHAKSTLESWGGRLEIKSQEHEGTTVGLIIPKEAIPNWFVPEIKLKVDSTVVIFDDDQSIHQIWKDRLESISKYQLNVFHFSNPNEFRAYYRKNFADLDHAVFLMDYEIINHSETGLDLIEECGIQNQSILVTSRFEEAQIRERCESLEVRLIPKSMSGFVPIKIS